MKIAAIRIKGQVGLKKEIVETLYRLRLRRKYTCVVFENPTEIQLGMLKKVRDFVTFGEIKEDTYRELEEKRGQKDKNKKLKPFFRLHPARGGMETKKHFGVGKGVLGENKKMDELIRRML
jgi:large subunit ribosomal protein L30